MTLHKSQEERRRDILDAARTRFVTDGYSRSRLNDVAADAGLSKGGVYFHFKSKREIFDALIDEDFDRVMKGLELIRGISGNIAAKITFFAQRALQLTAENPAIAKFAIVMGEMGLADEEIRERIAEQHELMVQGVKMMLEKGVEEGDLRADLDTDVGARLLVSLMDGLRAAIAAGLHKNSQFETLISDGATLLTEGFLARK
ncbi:MAG: AcrR family transcriptional regulator [Myxococcota bacterium]|jgi:AcrR family transcriptional regulator